MVRIGTFTRAEVPSNQLVRLTMARTRSSVKSENIVKSTPAPTTRAINLRVIMCQTLSTILQLTIELVRFRTISPDHENGFSAVSVLSTIAQETELPAPGCAGG